MNDLDFVYLCWSHPGDREVTAPASLQGVVATEDEAEAWRLAVTEGVRWWTMFEVGQPEQGRLDKSPEAHG